ncbi:sigma-70 family RNA polymerase sigma factor [Salinibacterium sp. UTAS2018]|uniref:RNA polymerase sigma factor n=1 Tax=Salinibacterium sp. UTAS2018 TaxID=2508880 RepID=UPI0010094F72|nr:sigma-70 family RNA polymerase sigma factor [Salinibacterium sp. UTAS2018]QAV70175.1 sigma-70 family RNA polymerase sigma factor [Salinibacterium sp. UTAS2018]
MNNDSGVIERSLREPAAFGELFHRYAASLHRYVARRAGEPLADDVTSETFLIAFERRATFDLGRDDARPWLFGIATNLIHRHRIAEARTLKSLERAAAEPEYDNSPNVDEIVDAQREVKKMARRLRRMSSGDRDCLLLFAWGDFTYEQIAQSLEIPVGTVRSRMNRARRILRTEPLSEEVHHEQTRFAPDSA